jgi:hypothetical protein
MTIVRKEYCGNHDGKKKHGGMKRRRSRGRGQGVFWCHATWLEDCFLVNASAQTCIRITLTFWMTKFLSWSRRWSWDINHYTCSPQGRGYYYYYYTITERLSLLPICLRWFTSLPDVRKPAIKLSLCLIKYHAMKTYRWSEVHLNYTRSRWVVSFTPRPFYSHGQSH